MPQSFSVSHWLSDSSLTHGNHCITRRSTGNKTSFHTHFQLPPQICHFLSILYLFIWNGNIATFLVCCIPDALPKHRVMAPTSPMHISNHIRELTSIFGYFFKQNFTNSEELWISLVCIQLVKRGKLTRGKGFAPLGWYNIWNILQTVPLPCCKVTVPWTHLHQIYMESSLEGKLRER